MIGRMHRLFLFTCLIGFTGLLQPVAFAQSKDAEFVRSAERKFVCFARAGCIKFKEAADACATAGNFDKCMQVKMNDTNLSYNYCEYSGIPKPRLKDMLTNKDLYDISNVLCIDVFAELKLAPLGYRPSFFDDLKKWFGDDRYWIK